jgi:hypothetical protein
VGSLISITELLMLDTVLEVIDLESFRVIARARFDELFHTFLGDGRIGGTVFEGGYVPVYQILELRLSGRTAHPGRERDPDRDGEGVGRGL